MNFFDFAPAVQGDVYARLLELAKFLCVVVACAGAMMIVYRRVSPARPSETEFSSTIFILTIAIGLLVMIIKQIPAISFGLFGAMSIVRFRTQIKKPRRMVFILMAVSVGVCSGAGEYMTTMLATLILAAMSLYMYAPGGAEHDEPEATTEQQTSALPAAQRLQPTLQPTSQPNAQVLPLVTVPGKAGPARTGTGNPATTTAPETAAAWGIDFASRAFGPGRLRVLVVVDEASRRILALTPEAITTGKRVAQLLARLSQSHGKPMLITSDTWPVFNGRRVLEWRASTGAAWIFREQAEAAEPRLYAWSIANRISDEKLGAAEPTTIEDMRDALEAWRIAHNTGLGTGADDSPSPLFVASKGETAALVAPPKLAASAGLQTGPRDRAVAGNVAP